MTGAAKSNDIVPNGEFIPAALVLNNGTPTGTVDLTAATIGGNAHTVMIVSDKKFYVGTAATDAAKNPLIDPATTPIYYHPVRDRATLFLRQGVAGETVNLRFVVFYTREQQ